MRKNYWKKISALFLTGAVFGWAYASAKAPKIVVIVKSDGVLASLDSKDIKAVYLGDKTFQGSTKIEPLVNGTEALSDLFMKKVLNKTKAQYKKIWNAKAFIDGLSAPAVVPASEDIIRAIEKNDDAIGFVLDEDIPKDKKDVKVIYTVDAGEK